MLPEMRPWKSLQSCKMPLKKLLENVAFDPETCAILADAFEAAWLELITADDPLSSDSRMADTKNFLANSIIKLAQEGERDLDRLCDHALARLRSFQGR